MEKQQHKEPRQGEMPRESDSRRNRSKYDRDLSPRRSRRDGKPAAERSPRKMRTEDIEKDKAENQQRRLQDPLPLRAPRNDDIKLGNSEGDKGQEGKDNGDNERRKQSDPTSVPRSRSFFQHDERGSAPHDGRTSRHRVHSERGWWRDSKDEQNNTSKTVADNTKRGDDKRLARAEDDQVWRHDRFPETESDPIPPAKKRRPFREEKVPVQLDSAPKPASAGRSEPYRPARSETGIGRREERGSRSSHFSRSNDRDRSHVRESWLPNRGSRENDEFNSRGRYGRNGGGRRYDERERSDRRQDNRSGFSGGQIEKWKHDLFDQADVGATPKKEEDPIAKVEELLAS